MIDQPNDPQNPILLKTLNDNCVGQSNCFAVGIDAHSPHHPHLHGNLLFVTWYEAGLQVFNIADPVNPIHVGSFDTYPGTSSNFNGLWGVDLSLGLNRVLLSDQSRGLIVVDASRVVPTGDYNQNNSVNNDDYNAWSSSFGDTNSGQHIAPLADGNYNGIVDAADYVVWRKFEPLFGAGGGSSGGDSFVPEPAAILLFAIGMGLAAGRRISRNVLFSREH
jgi:hypothetical protein